MKTKDIITGMQILAPYYKEPNGYHTGADHDVIYAYATDSPVSTDDIAALVSLGWFQSGGANDDGGKYSPDESWQAFT